MIRTVSIHEIEHLAPMESTKPEFRSGLIELLSHLPPTCIRGIRRLLPLLSEKDQGALATKAREVWGEDPSNGAD